MALNSKIILCKNIKVDRNYKNCLTYSESDMLSLCNTNAVKIGTDFTFIGGKGSTTIEVPYTYAECLQCNYLAYQNTLYSNKWYFCFIDSVEYRNDNSTRITFTVDYFHTWYDYYDKKSCYVVREHVSDDTVGNYTLEENLALGDEYIIRDHIVDSNIGDPYLYLSSTYNPETRSEDWGGVYNGLYSGQLYYCYPLNQISGKIQTIIDNSGYNAISSVFVAPRFLNNRSGRVPDTTTEASYDFFLDKITTIGSFIPKNKKLLTFPYVYIEVSNMVGGATIFKQELFNRTTEDNQYWLVVEGALCPGASVRVSPMYYNGVNGKNSEYGLTLGKFPVCNWAGDIYTNYMTQNGINIFSSALTGSFATVDNLAIGDYEGATSGVFQTLSAYNEIHKAQMIPPQIQGNVNAGDVLFSTGDLTFHYYIKTIKEEVARSIDDYFSMFGYKVNKLKVPNINTRSVFNYIQIATGEILAYQKSNVLSIPPQDLEEINNIYRKGVTLWHNHANIGNYSLNNTVVS